MPERAPHRRSIGCARGRRGRALALGWALVAGLLLAPVGRGTTRPPSAAAQASVLDIDVTVRGIARLYAAEIGLRFDPTQVTPVDAMPSRPGLQLAAGSGWGGSPFTLVNAIDADAGTARFAATLLAPAPALTGDRVLVTLRLSPRRLEPEDAWGLTDVRLVDRRGQVLEAVWEGVEIRPVIAWTRLEPGAFLPWTASGP
ncbi:MAG: hypothetical protein KDH92_00410 [Chloroflexi bacterium]|nr:hypothetical protein [Chloroflexota bacterium]